MCDMVNGSSIYVCVVYFFFFSSRRRHTRLVSDWSSDVCSSDLVFEQMIKAEPERGDRREFCIAAADPAAREEPEGDHEHQRSEERRVGKECRSRWTRDD